MASQKGAAPVAKKPRTAQQPAAPPAASPSPPAPLAVAELLEMDSAQSQAGHLFNWAKGTKEYVDYALLKFLSEKQALVSFKVPASVMPIPPLQISAAASGAHLTSFRE
eukprot:2928113-Pyramimonas_sp.AAC.1